MRFETMNGVCRVLDLARSGSFGVLFSIGCQAMCVLGVAVAVVPWYPTPYSGGRVWPQKLASR